MAESLQVLCEPYSRSFQPGLSLCARWAWCHRPYTFLHSDNRKKSAQLADSDLVCSSADKVKGTSGTPHSLRAGRGGHGAAGMLRSLDSPLSCQEPNAHLYASVLLILHF